MIADRVMHVEVWRPQNLIGHEQADVELILFIGPSKGCYQ